MKKFLFFMTCISFLTSLQADTTFTFTNKTGNDIMLRIKASLTNTPIGNASVKQNHCPEGFGAWKELVVENNKSMNITVPSQSQKKTINYFKYNLEQIFHFEKGFIVQVVSSLEQQARAQEIKVRQCRLAQDIENNSFFDSAFVMSCQMNMPDMPDFYPRGFDMMPSNGKTYEVKATPALLYLGDYCVTPN